MKKRERAVLGSAAGMAVAREKKIPRLEMTPKVAVSLYHVNTM